MAGDRPFLVERSGRAFVSHAIVDGLYALRMCIVNFRTGPEDIRTVADLSVELGREADRALRSQLPDPSG